MTLCINDVIEIPESKPPLVVKVGEIDDEERKAACAREYVITETVAAGLRVVVKAVAQSADTGFPGQGIWVNGSFGTGKSHFLSFAGMLLRGEPAAWNRNIPGLDAKGDDSPLAQLLRRPAFVVPFNSVAGPRDFRLGLYQAVAKELARLGLPPVELTEFGKALSWFEGLAQATPALWETLFQRSLVVGSREEYEAKKATAAGQEELAREIRQWFGPPGTEAFAVELVTGIQRLTAHLQAHGYGVVVFLIDEMTLFLINAQDKTAPLVDLKNLLEAPEAKLPVWALVVRHAPLEDVVRTVGKDLLDNVKGRFFSKEVDIADVDLYQVLGQRVLRRRPGKEAALEIAVRESLERIPKEQLDVLHELYGHQRFDEAVRRLYPFHPAIVDTLVSVTNLLSRERTAISIMYDMLFAVKDEPLGTLLPYSLAFEYLIEEAAESELLDQPTLQAARMIMRDKVRPLLEKQYLGEPKAIERGETVARSIILGELTNKGTPLQGKMTAELVAALNAAVLNGQVMVLARKQLEEAITLLCEQLLGTFRRDGEVLTVELTMGLDPMEELRKLADDVSEERRQAVREILGSFFGTDSKDGRRNLDIKWRGTSRRGWVQAVETGTAGLPQPPDTAEFAIWIGLPRFAGDRCPPAPPANGVPGALWLPAEASDEVSQRLERLARIIYLTRSEKGKTLVAEKYSGEQGRDLKLRWDVAAQQLLETLKSELEPLYHQGTVQSSRNVGGTVPFASTLQETLKDLAARLLDTRYRQHPSFTKEVTAQALEGLYQALIKGEGRVRPDMGEPYSYAQAYGEPLRVLKPSGTSYVVDMGNSRYVQELEQKVKGAQGARLADLRKHLAEMFGLQSQVSDFLARLAVAFRDLRVLRNNKPVAVPDLASLKLEPGDMLAPGGRVTQAEWAAFAKYYSAVGLGNLAGEPSVRAQDAAWAELARSHSEWEKRAQALRNRAATAGKAVGGAPEAIDTALKSVEATLGDIRVTLTAPSSEAGIAALAKLTAPKTSVAEQLAKAEEMVARLERLEQLDAGGAYGRLTDEEIRIFRELIAEYVGGTKDIGTVQAFATRLPRPGFGGGEATKAKVKLRARWGKLRQSLEHLGAKPVDGWGGLDSLSDDAEVTVEVRSDA